MQVGNWTKTVKYNQSKVDVLFEAWYWGTCCVVVSEAGEIAMLGFEPIRRYGLVFVKNNQEANFVSLGVLQKGRKPYRILCYPR